MSDAGADAPSAEPAGVATADFAPEQLGFRTPSLFVTGNPVLAPGGDLAFLSSDPAVAERLSSLAAPILPMLSEWIGAENAPVLTIVDRPGVPFAEGDLLVMPVSGVTSATLTPALVSSLAHARFRSSHVWLNQGVPQFLSLVWVERNQGRTAAHQCLGGRNTRTRSR